VQCDVVQPDAQHPGERSPEPGILRRVRQVSLPAGYVPGILVWLKLVWLNRGESTYDGKTFFFKPVRL
jgi:hypothetical protein